MMWGIKKDLNVMNVWFGEIIINVLMGFFYVFLLLVVLYFVNLFDFIGWFFILLVMWMVLQLGGIFRNMLQNWFQCVSGVDEEYFVNLFFIGIFLMIKGFINVFFRVFLGFRSSGKESYGLGFIGYEFGSSLGKVLLGGLGGSSGMIVEGGILSSKIFGSGLILMGGFLGVFVLLLFVVDFSNVFRISLLQLFIIWGIRNIYVDMDFIRKVFVQNFVVFIGKSLLYVIGSML